MDHAAMTARARRMVNEAEAVQFLQEILRIPSLLGQEARLAAHIEQRLRGFGLQVWAEDAEPNRPTVTGTLRGAGGGKSLVLNGHMDHYPPSHDWTMDPYGGTRAGDRIHGVGANDMKAGLAAAIMAVKFVVDAQVPLRGDLSCMAIPGHFEGGLGTRHAIRRGFRSDYAIVCEPSDLRLVLAQMGTAYLRITTRGRQAHTTAKAEGINAIEHMVAFIERLRRHRLAFTRHPLFDYDPIMNIGTIQGGFAHNLVPDRCAITVDFRILPSQTPEGVKAEVEGIAADLAREIPGFAAEVEFIEAWLKGPRTPSSVAPDAPPAAALRRSLAEVRGTPPADWGAPYWTDIAVFNEAGIVAVSCGPGREPYIWTDEYVTVGDYLD
ncbi:MAG: M20/M25/M40 family metallo-hydrolase, partial [Armatimonadetes bacterium]|nr:M20/M25/M40 family metallo-hydrolase [Armatimonadota bacterium]